MYVPSTRYLRKIIFYFKLLHVPLFPTIVVRFMISCIVRSGVRRSTHFFRKKNVFPLNSASSRDRNYSLIMVMADSGRMEKNTSFTLKAASSRRFHG